MDSDALCIAWVMGLVVDRMVFCIRLPPHVLYMMYPCQGYSTFDCDDSKMLEMPHTREIVMAVQTETKSITLPVPPNEHGIVEAAAPPAWLRKTWSIERSKPQRKLVDTLKPI